MPCPHNEITIVQRSQRQSAVAAAAYEAPADLFWERWCGGDSLLYFYKRFSGDTGIVPDDGSAYAAVFLFGDVRKAWLPGREPALPAVSAGAGADGISADWL